jgi:DNA helicase IV
MNNTQTMTITERNQKLYDLHVKMDKLNAQLAWVKQEIWIVKDQYDRQNLNLFEEMFGTDVTYTDTPMAEEVYGG